MVNKQQVLKPSNYRRNVENVVESGLAAFCAKIGLADIPCMFNGSTSVEAEADSKTFS